MRWWWERPSRLDRIERTLDYVARRVDRMGVQLAILTAALPEGRLQKFTEELGHAADNLAAAQQEDATHSHKET
jgi:hypothetical protein